jgi:hypothetical protein
MAKKIVEKKIVEKKTLETVTIKNTHKSGRPILGRDGLIKFGETAVVRKCDLSQALIEAGHVTVIEADKEAGDKAE